MKIERRYAGKIELRAAAREDSVGVLTGYAAVFNRDSVDLGGFVERVAPGAFTQSISGGDVCALWSHENESILGRMSAGTLRLREDDVGLAFEIDLPDTSCGRDASVSIRRGDVCGMSFGFCAEEETWTFDVEPAIRTLQRVSLVEISPVAFPAYVDSTVALRSLDAARAAVKPAAAIPAIRSVARARMAGRLILSA